MIAEAAAATIAAGTARLSAVRFNDPPDDLSDWEDGVTDLRARRTLVEQRFGPGHDRLAEQLAENWPWLGLTDDEPDGPSRMAYLDDASYFGFPDRWTRMGEWTAARRGHTDPTWILDAMPGVVEERELGADEVRSVATTRWSATLDLRRVDVERAPFAVDHVYAEVWLDDERRLRRATWSPTAVRSRRVADTTRRPWRSVELWDFGITVDIPTPEVASGAVVGGLFELWRRRRDWRREHPA